MNQSPTGNAIGNDTIGLADDGTVLTPGQVQFGRDYLAAHISAQKPFLTDAENLELALGMAKLAGNAIITHVPGWDRVTVAPNVSPGLDRPKPAVAQQEDGQGKFMALWWKIGPEPTAWRRIDAGAVPGFPGFYRGPMRPVGADDPGDSGLVADGLHSHPAANPHIEGSFLYTATVGGDVWSACATLMGGYISPFKAGGGWSRTGPGEWTRGIVGAINTFSFATGLFDGMTPYVGMRVFSTYSETAGWRMYDGIYIVAAIGSDTTYARIVRAADLDASAEFIPSKCVQVTGGNTNAGHVFRYVGPESPVVDTDLLTWHDLGVATPPSGLSFELLTGRELTTRQANTNNYDLAWSQSFGGETQAPESFLTIAGTPGVTSLPAGLQEFQVENVTVVTGASSGTTTLKLKCYVVEADGGTIVQEAFEVESLSIPHNAAPVTLKFQHTLEAAITMTTAYRLVLIPFVSTDVTELLTISMRVNSQSRGTWWKTTMTFAAFGTTNHLLLEATAQDVGKGEQPDHPWCAIGPAGRIHTKIGIGTATNGLLDIPADCNSCEVDLPTADLVGINTDGFLPGDVIRVTVTNASTSTPKTLRHGQTPAAPYKGLVLAKDTMSSYQPIVLKNSPARMAFQLSRAGDSWHLVERPIA